MFSCWIFRSRVRLAKFFALFPRIRVYNYDEEGVLTRPKGLKLMSRRDYDEGYEDARREMEERELGSSRRCGGDFTTAMLIKYLAIITITYLVLQILGVVQGAFYRVL
jgi:hypothetical protein